MSLNPVRFVEEKRLFKVSTPKHTTFRRTTPFCVLSIVLAVKSVEFISGSCTKSN